MTGTTRATKWVEYLHHTRDRDVILYFRDGSAACADGQYLESSPVAAIRPLAAAVAERGGERADCFVVSTLNTDYVVRMPRAKAEHLAWELGRPLPV